MNLCKTALTYIRQLCCDDVEYLFRSIVFEIHVSTAILAVLVFKYRLIRTRSRESP